MTGSRRQRLAIAGAALIVLAVLAFVVQTDNAITRADAEIVRSIAEARSPLVVNVARAITLLGNFFVLLAITVAFGAIARLRFPALRLSLTPLAALLLVSAINPLLKIAVDRPRPPADVAVMTLGANGFPSGHSAQAMAVWLSIALVLAAARPQARRLIIAAGIGVAVLVGLSRVVLGVHSPTDVVGGWAFGLAVALLTRELAETLAREPKTALRMAPV